MGLLGSPPIQPSPPPPVFCAQCGVEVDPASWECANCHSSLHVPDAMTSSRPIIRGAAKKSRPAFNFQGKLFAVLLVAGLVVLDEGLRNHLFPDRLVRPLYWLNLVVILVALWAIGLFDRQRP